MTPRLTIRLMGLCGVLMFVLAAPASGQWVPVATAGLDDPTQREVSGLAVFGSEAYLATHGLGTGVPRVFRATIRDDHTWADVTPSGMTGEVTSIGVVVDELLVSTEGDASHDISGQLWRRDLAGAWTDITPAPPDWGSARAILFATGWTPRRGGRTLCVARQGLEVWCKEDLLPWSLLPLPGSLGTDATIGSARLQAFEDALYLGFGSLTDGGRKCEAWRYDFGPRRWQAVSTTCFGYPGTPRLLSMAVFDRLLYFGTGGAGAGSLATINRTDGRTLLDVTPCDLYGGCTGLSFTPSPVRFNALASAGTQLFAGVRQPNGPAAGGDGGGYVLNSDDGKDWHFDSPRGFTVLANEEVTALGSNRAYLYAGTFNANGFEVYRRTPSLSVLYPYLVTDTFSFLRGALTIRACLLSRRACDFTPVLGPIEAMSLAFDAARDPKDDQTIVKLARANMTEVANLIAQAQQLASAASQAKDPATAKQLWRDAANRLDDAIQLVWTTTVAIGDHVGASGQRPPKDAR